MTAPHVWLKGAGASVVSQAALAMRSTSAGDVQLVRTPRVATIIDPWRPSD